MICACLYLSIYLPIALDGRHFAAQIQVELKLKAQILPTSVNDLLSWLYAETSKRNPLLPWNAFVSCVRIAARFDSYRSAQSKPVGTTTAPTQTSSSNPKVDCCEQVAGEQTKWQVCELAQQVASLKPHWLSLSLSIYPSASLIGLSGDACHLLTCRPKVDVRDSSRRAIYSTSELTFCFEFVDSLVRSIVRSIAFVAMLLFHITGSLRFILSLIHLAHSRKSQ